MPRLSMLDVSLHAVSNFALRDITVTFPAGTHTAVVGLPGSGASTLLRLIAGTLRPEAGQIRIGTRLANDLRPRQRPLLHVTSAIDLPGRWSVRHALVAAVRRRSLDRIDRQREYSLAVEKWDLTTLADRTLRTLSDSELTGVILARIELLRPGILLADRLLERLNAAVAEEVVDRLYRTLRVAGTTVISAPATLAELGATDRVIVLSGGSLVQDGTAAHLYAHPAHDATASATGPVNVVPVTIRGQLVESAIGSWEVGASPFQGSGVALIRPQAFQIAPAGQESHLIVAVEEAAFGNGWWVVRSFLSGGLVLRIALPPETRLHKGKLLALTYRPEEITLLRREAAQPPAGPTGALPTMRDSR